MPDDRVVAVVGATGRQGGAVTRHLLAEGWQVRALTRKPESTAARDLAAHGAVVIRADMDDPDTLSNAFRDARSVYSVQNPMISGLDAEVAHGRKVADAAKRAGVQHLCTAPPAWVLPVPASGRGSRSWKSSGTWRASGCP
jgi:uncharacterized protein YbjT (DUF2867 family)